MTFLLFCRDSATFFKNRVHWSLIDITRSFLDEIRRPIETGDGCSSLFVQPMVLEGTFYQNMHLRSAYAENLKCNSAIAIRQNRLYHYNYHFLETGIC